jgi:lipoate-protein ligase A
MNHKTICKEKKHPGGKLVKICVNIMGGEVQGVLLTGDFFAEPENAVEDLISSLLNLKCHLFELKEKALGIIRERSVKIIGINEEDIEKALSDILENPGP